MKIRKEDNVLVITGKDKGKKGKVRFVFPRKNRVLIEGVNMIKTHSRARQQVKQAGLIEREASIALFSSRLYENCPGATDIMVMEIPAFSISAILLSGFLNFSRASSSLPAGTLVI